jgi:integrase
MASLHKDPRGKSPFWYCAYTLPDGRRTLRSTKQRDRKKAAEICRTLEIASLKARTGELTEARVRKLLDEVLENVGEERVRSVTVRSFTLSWLEGKKLSVRPQVLRLYRRAFERFWVSLGLKADKPLASLTPADITAFQDTRGRDVSVGTLLLDLKTIRSALASARRQGLILSNPAEAVDLPTNKPITREVFIPQELRALLDAASPEWRTLILCGYYLGGRLSDMAALRWEDIEFAPGASVANFTQRKTARAITIPLHPELEEWLLSIATDAGGPLCPSLAPTPLTGRYGLSSQFAALIEKAGLSRNQVKATNRIFSRKSYHSLRHSFTSALANAGVAPELRMKLTEHLSLSTHQGYTHHELAPLRTAVNSLPRLLP